MIYDYPIKAINGDLLTQQILGAGLPTPQVSVDDFNIHVAFIDPLTTEQKTTLDGIIQAHTPPVPKRPRSVDAVFTDISALSNPNQLAIWNYLAANVNGKPRWRQSSNHALWTPAGLQANFAAGALQDNARRLVATLWVLEVDANGRLVRPSEYVNPSFAPTINIAADEPIP